MQHFTHRVTRGIHNPRRAGARAQIEHRSEPLERRVLLATVVVDLSADELNGNVTSIAALQLTPGGGGISLREAITAANNTGGSNVIHFGIPGVGPHILNINTELPTISGTLRIDGYTQGGATVNTLGIGNDATLKIQITTAQNLFRCLAIDPAAKNSVIRGLSITSFPSSAVFLNAPDCIVEGNWLGVTPGGAQAGNSEGVRVFDKAESALVGGASEAARNVIAGSSGHGVVVRANGCTILGNHIGTNPAGNAAMANENGVKVDASFTTIGGLGVLRRNLISGNTNYGIAVFKGKRHDIVGNFIGHPAEGGAKIGNGNGGIRIFSGSKILIGSRTEPKEGNLISHNGGSGITVEEGEEITMRFNSIHHNVADETGERQLGIDLLGLPEDGFGTTANDDKDPDDGANSLQNWPILMTADSTTTATTITGSLNSTPLTEFIIDFYGNTEDDPSQHGEGESWFGFTVVTTNIDGNVTFGVPNNATGLPFISATATTSASTPAGEGAGPTGPNQTSEFSTRVANARPGGVIPVSSVAPSGPNTYLAANAAAALSPGPDTIVLSLPVGSFEPITLGGPFFQPFSNTLVDLTGGGFGHLVPRMFFIGGGGGLSRHQLDGNNTLRGVGLVSGSAQQVDFTGDNNNVYDMFINVSPEGKELGATTIAFGAPVRFLPGQDNWFMHNVVHAGRGNPMIASFGAENVWIKYNRIGMNLEGRVFGGTANNENGYGLDIDDSTNVWISDNWIAGSTGDGFTSSGDAVVIDQYGGDSDNVRVYRNSMSLSLGLGVDWNDDGITVNDNPDADGVPNFPEINQAWIMPEGTRVIGSLTTTANTPVTIHAYSSPPTPAIGTNEGKLYLGVIPVTTNGSGVANFDSIVMGRAASFGDLIMLTATGPLGTSEFSGNVPAQDNVPPAVEEAEFEYETRHSISITLDGDADDGTIAPEDLVVQSAGEREAIFIPDAVYYDEQTRQAVFSFFSILPDGDYTATLPVGSIADAAGNALASPFSFGFFVLGGDANRDRVVNSDDFNILATNFGLSGKTFSEGNFNYDPDGLVNSDDFNILATNFGLSIAAQIRRFGATKIGQGMERGADELLDELR